MNDFQKELSEQPKALLDTAAWMASGEGRHILDGIVSAWKSGTFSRIVATGMGSSFFIAEAFACLAAGKGIPAFSLNAGELLHYGRPLLGPSTLLLAISQSGESYETVEVIRTSGHPRDAVVALTNEPESSLSRLAGYTLLTHAGCEQMTSSKTFITSWQVACTLVHALAGNDSFEVRWDALAAQVQDLLNRPVTEAVRLIGDAPFLTFIARGTDVAAARQSALMCMEALHLPAVALTGGDFRHGPLEMAGPDKAIVVSAPSSSPTFSLGVRLAEDILRFDGKVIWVSDQVLPARENLCHLPLPDLPDPLNVIPAVIPMQRLVCALADRRGMVPGGFHHGNKVTAIE